MCIYHVYTYYNCNHKRVGREQHCHKYYDYFKCNLHAVPKSRAGWCRKCKARFAAGRQAILDHIAEDSGEDSVHSCNGEDPEQAPEKAVPVPRRTQSVRSHYGQAPEQAPEKAPVQAPVQAAPLPRRTQSVRSHYGQAPVQAAPLPRRTQSTHEGGQRGNWAGVPIEPDRVWPRRLARRLTKILGRLW